MTNRLDNRFIQVCVLWSRVVPASVWNPALVDRFSGFRKVISRENTLNGTFEAPAT